MKGSMYMELMVRNITSAGTVLTVQDFYGSMEGGLI